MIAKQRSVFVIQTWGKIQLCSPWSRQHRLTIIIQSSFKTGDSSSEKNLPLRFEIQTYQKIKSRNQHIFSNFQTSQEYFFSRRMIGLQPWPHRALQSIIVIRNSELLIWNNDGWSLLWTFGQCWPLSNAHFEHLEGRLARHRAVIFPALGKVRLVFGQARLYAIIIPLFWSHIQSYIHS